MIYCVMMANSACFFSNFASSLNLSDFKGDFMRKKAIYYISIDNFKLEKSTYAHYIILLTVQF